MKSFQDFLKEQSRFLNYTPLNPNIKNTKIINTTNTKIYDYYPERTATIYGSNNFILY